LRGWWHGRALSHLSRVAEGRADWIELAEIEDRLLAIAQSLRDDNLPWTMPMSPNRARVRSMRTTGSLSSNCNLSFYITTASDKPCTTITGPFCNVPDGSANNFSRSVNSISTTAA
jgi:hypothetical protein